MPRIDIVQLEPPEGINDGDALIYNASSGSFVVNSISGSGISEIQHRALRQLIHFIDDGPAEGFITGAYKEIHDSFFPTGSIWYTDSSKTNKIVEKIINRSPPSGSNILPNPITWKMYDTDGSSILVTVQDNITYSGIREINRERIITI